MKKNINDYKDLKDYYKDLPLGKKISLRFADIFGTIIVSLPFVAVTIGIITGLFAGISYIVKDYRKQVNG